MTGLALWVGRPCNRLVCRCSQWEARLTIIHTCSPNRWEGYRVARVASSPTVLPMSVSVSIIPPSLVTCLANLDSSPSTMSMVMERV